MTEYFVTWKDPSDDEPECDSIWADNPSEAADLAMRKQTIDNPELELECLDEETLVMTVYEARDGDESVYMDSQNEFSESLKKREPAGVFECNFVPARVDVKSLAIPMPA